MDPVLYALVAAVVTFLFIFLFFVAFLLHRCYRVDEKEQSLASGAAAPSPPILYAANSWTATPTGEGDESASFDPSLDRVSMSELVAATQNFDPNLIIGDGGFGFVYKARLASGATVAVKRLSADAFQGHREFRAEMETLGRIRHPNLTRLLGFCAAGRDRVLIYEFLPGGSLDQWLHERPAASGDSNSGGLLPWSTRVGIVRGVAAGLAYLHEVCRPPIIHRDIKAGNVLLDGEFGSRIADFGLARRVESSKSHVSTQVAGTVGYMPPEYREGATVATAKADVYSFGVLLLEMATGRRPNLAVQNDHGKHMDFVGWARMMIEMGRWMEILDPSMGRDGLEERDVLGYLNVGLKCTEDYNRRRPTMGEVVTDLNQL